MLERKNNWKAWIYLAPALVLLAIFTFYPIINSIVIAFIENYHPVESTFEQNIAANGGFKMSFKNFITVFHEIEFKNAVKNTLVIALVSVPLSVIISLLISVALNSIKPLKGFFQTVYFLPYVTSAMAVAMAFTVMFSNTDAGGGVTYFGPINTILKSIKIDRPVMKLLDWLNWISGANKTYAEKYASLTEQIDAAIARFGESGARYESRVVPLIQDRDALYDTYRYSYQTLGYIDWVGTKSTWATQMFVILIYSIWNGLAFKILVFVGGLQGIDKQYYEAAKIDATPKRRVFWKITVPLLSPLISYIFITSFMGAFKVYTSIIGLFGNISSIKSKGLQTFVAVVYGHLGEGNSELHLAAAASLMLFLIILVITGIQGLINKRHVHY